MDYQSLSVSDKIHSMLWFLSGCMVWEVSRKGTGGRNKKATSNCGPTQAEQFEPDLYATEMLVGIAASLKLKILTGLTE